MESEGKFGRAALAIATVASVTLLTVIFLALFLMFTGHGTRAINYIVGMTILFCWLFELIAIVIGIIGLFENAGKKRVPLTAIAISVVGLLGTLAPILIEKNGGFH